MSNQKTIETDHDEKGDNELVVHYAISCRGPALCECGPGWECQLYLLKFGNEFFSVKIRDVLPGQTIRSLAGQTHKPEAL